MMLVLFHCCTHVHTKAQFCLCFVILSQSRRPFDQCLVVVVTDPETKHSNSITVGNPIHHSPLSDHIQPHPLSPPPFLLISSHWWVESVDYHWDEDASGPKWEASARNSPVEGVSHDLHAARGRAAVGGQRAVGAFHLGQPEGGKEKPFTCDWNRPKNGHQCKQTRSSTPLGLVSKYSLWVTTISI